MQADIFFLCPGDYGDHGDYENSVFDEIDLKSNVGKKSILFSFLFSSAHLEYWKLRYSPFFW